MNQKVYTVVALYPDGQSFVEAFLADDPHEAGELCAKTMAANLGDVDADFDNRNDYEIVAVFEGSHMDLYPRVSVG